MYDLTIGAVEMLSLIHISKGRYSSSVPVNYCPIRNLKRVPGAKPGFVSLTNYKTIYIDPEEAVIDNLLKENA